MHLVSPEELSGLITARLKQQPTVLVALDGRCGSGKTTLAAQLAERFPQSITLHTDDFYLPPPQRVTGWERIPCANMHLDGCGPRPSRRTGRAGRMLQGLLLPGGCLSAARVLGPAPLVIVEGSYSHHPSLAPYYDIKVFVTCSAEEQMRRLRAREGKRYLNFVQRWIPLEEEYFTDYAIERNAEMTVVTGE